jgi:hypothetical protein
MALAFVIERFPAQYRIACLQRPFPNSVMVKVFVQNVPELTGIVLELYERRLRSCRVDHPWPALRCERSL